MIIDCHTHFSQLTDRTLAFSRVRDRLLEEMEQAGIAVSVIMPDSESGSAVADLSTTLELTVGQPSLRPMATAHIESLDANVVSGIENLAVAGTIAGLKLYPGFEEFYPDDTACRPLYDICLRHGLPVILHSGETLQERWREEFNHPWEIARLAEDMPELQIVIAHFSQPHLEVCREILVKLPNVHADISGLAHPSTERVCGKDFIRQVLEDTVREKPEKVLFGTDWPICDVGQHIGLVNSLDVTPEAKDLVFSGNARRLFNLGI